MTVASALYNFLDTLPECNMSGWKLFDGLVAITGRETYPNTLLQYARRYADMAGAEFVCVDAARNVKLFGSTKRAECLEQTSVDRLVNTSLLMKTGNVANGLVEAKNEAARL